MKNQRQNLIMQIVKDENIGTQEELREALKRHGLKVTQATVSRDIKELSLVKTIGSDGNYKYSLPALKKDIAEQNNGIFGIISDAVVSVDHALNTVVVKWAKTWHADAIIGRFDNDDNVELFRENGIIALAQDYKSRFSNIPNITGDYRKTGRMAAEFFLSKGFQNFAFYGYRDTVWSQERCEGFYECIAAQGFGNNFYSYQDQSLDDLWFYEAPPLLNWLKSLPQPTALMACDDNQGNRITEICKVNNIRVPDKIAILGVDNDEIICNLSDPPLSSISQNIVRGGFEAAALIEHLLNDEEATYQDVVLQPVNIINRLSTDFYSTTDAHIQTALKYIHQNIAADITVSDIVKQVPLSRRLLEIRFKQVTQQSIHKYIFNLRMERFAQLLLASDAPIADVAEQVGINNLKNLSRQFKALKKVSPNEYRKEYQTKSYQR